jgi:hypothetical protein
VGLCALEVRLVCNVDCIAVLGVEDCPGRSEIYGRHLSYRVVHDIAQVGQISHKCMEVPALCSFTPTFLGCQLLRHFPTQS